MLAGTYHTDDNKFDLGIIKLQIVVVRNVHIFYFLDKTWFVFLFLNDFLNIFSQNLYLLMNISRLITINTNLLLL